MRIKPGVSIRGLVSEVAGVALGCAESVYRAYGVEVVITSGTEYDGRHKRGSAHWTGRAVDIRVKNLPEADRAPVAGLIGAALGVEFDVLHEGVGKAWEHIHIEYDPKGGA